MTSDTLTLAAEALKPFADGRALFLEDFKRAAEALAAITAEQSRVPPDRADLARRLEERSYHVRTTQDTVLLREAAAILRLPAREDAEERAQICDICASDNPPIDRRQALRETAAFLRRIVAIDNTAWLIERRDAIKYWGSVLKYSDDCDARMGTFDLDWTPDHSAAMRFSRREDAQKLIDGYQWGNEVKAVEHMWLPAPPAEEPPR